MRKRKPSAESPVSSQESHFAYPDVTPVSKIMNDLISYFESRYAERAHEQGLPFIMTAHFLERLKLALQHDIALPPQEARALVDANAVLDPRMEMDRRILKLSRMVIELLVQHMTMKEEMRQLQGQSASIAARLEMLEKRMGSMQEPSQALVGTDPEISLSDDTDPDINIQDERIQLQEIALSVLAEASNGSEEPAPSPQTVRPTSGAKNGSRRKAQ